MQLGKAQWSLDDTITWICDRNEKRVNDPMFRVGSLAARTLYPNGDGLLEAAKELLNALCAGTIQASRLNPDGATTLISAGYWNKKSITELQQPAEEDVIIASSAVKAAFPVENEVRVTPEVATQPRLSVSKLQKWFDNLSVADRFMPQDKLLSRCKSAHPDHSITRQRIRDLTPGRKQGPRPIGQKTTA
jgi:hypothetical protein